MIRPNETFEEKQERYFSEMNGELKSIKSILKALGVDIFIPQKMMCGEIHLDIKR